MKVVLLPLKDPAHAKQRLAGHLTPKERQELAWAMLEDVTRAVGAAITPDQVVVVTRGYPLAGDRGEPADFRESFGGSFQPALAAARSFGCFAPSHGHSSA
jgi:2-phospho-L-lactate guanylyltransferase (CobY/MobA/RfbA family)